MDILIRNGIILENILPFINGSDAIKISAVCKTWYDRINNDNVLWKRCILSENIEDPEQWNRNDDADLWILGTPCDAKKIFINYRRTYYCMKNGIYKKYDIHCVNDDNLVFDGKTLFCQTLYKEIHVYKIIKNNLELFQRLDLSTYNLDTNLVIRIYSNTEFILIINGINKMITFRLSGNVYVYYNERSFEEFGEHFLDYFGKLLDSNVLVGSYLSRDTDLLIVWNIPENRLLVNAYENRFVKYDKCIVYVHNLETNKLVLYNKEFEEIYSILIDDDRALGVYDVLVNEQMLFLFNYHRFGSVSLSVYDKSTGQSKIGSTVFNVEKGEKLLRIFLVNDMIILMKRRWKNGEACICSYSATTFCQLWSENLVLPSSPKNAIYYRFNQFLLFKDDANSKEYSLEFRNIKTGKVLHTSKYVKHFSKLVRDMAMFHELASNNATLLLFR